MRRVTQYTWPRRLWHHLYCRFFHRRYRCYPEVWDRGLAGPWHCQKCRPCGEALDILLDQELHAVDPETCPHNTNHVIPTYSLGRSTPVLLTRVCTRCGKHKSTRVSGDS